jgi:hypothetical protein
MDAMIDQIEYHELEAKRLRADLLKAVHEERERPPVFAQEISDRWSAYHGDCVEVIKGIPTDSVHYTIFSPPFSSLFTYSASLRDMGNSNDEQFYSHFDYLAPEMFRVTVPGRLCTMHCSDIPAMKERDGWMGLKDFPGELRMIMERHGWIYHSRHVIWKNPLIEATRTKALGLMHKQLVKDSSRCRAGLPDYLMTFIKPGENPFPISHGRGFEQYIGEDHEPRQPKKDDPAMNRYSHHVWQRYASPVWMDINQTNTLNIRLAREKNDERHICPLQLDVITRCLTLWSNPGEIIASWFAGIGSEGYQSLLMGRKFLGVELKESYYNVMIRYLKQASSSKKSILLEDL